MFGKTYAEALYFVTTASGTTLVVSPDLADALGVSGSELMGWNWGHCLPAAAMQAHLRHLRSAMASGVGGTWETAYRRGCGCVWPASVTLWPAHDSHGRVGAWVGFIDPLDRVCQCEEISSSA